jgi:hypothetical protein
MLIRGKNDRIKKNIKKTKSYNNNLRQILRRMGGKIFKEKIPITMKYKYLGITITTKMNQKL